MTAHPSPRLLILEDDQRLANMVATYLSQNGFEVVHAETADAGLKMLLACASTDRPFSILLLDVMLPDGNGLEVCRRIRALPSVDAIPIVMLTAKGDPMDRVVGLELGADDYLPKPFEPRELLARLRAVLRRPRATAAPQEDVLRFGQLEIDRAARSLRVRGRETTVTAHQFNLLVAMAERPGRVLSREQLQDLVKGESLDANDRSIDVHVGRLRAAIEDDPKKPRRIITVRGAGYVFARSQDGAAVND
jgi:DNA-binding response OmpR family regulator